VQSILPQLVVAVSTKQSPCGLVRGGVDFITVIKNSCQLIREGRLLRW
jgi:hypothetical protein